MYTYKVTPADSAKGRERL